MGKPVAVVTGSSSGIGYETALELARNGFEVYATMRNIAKSGRRLLQDAAAREGLQIKVVQLDVDSDSSVDSAIGSILQETSGRIDVLVNNAGYGLMGAVEDLGMDELKAQFETNFFGLVRVTQAVLPAMRRQKGGGGRIINIGSIAGRIAFPFSPAYTSTKFALEGLSEAMSHELAPFGIHVVVIEPGMIRTNFAQAAVTAKKAARADSPYAPTMQKMYASAGRLLENAAPASEVARIVREAATAMPEPQFRYTVGRDAARLAAAAKAARSDNEFLTTLRRSYGLASAPPPSAQEAAKASSSSSNQAE
jgi:NAD(P)-dependent dehydrogenase (short-subunit alcohol dehydrogenase family)